MIKAPVLAYTAHGNCYLNVTNRCTLRCRFCPKFNDRWEIDGVDLRLPREPSAGELIDAVGDPGQYREVVFCGLGEPTLRLYTVIETGIELRQRGARVRLNTDGLASHIHGRDVTPDLEDSVDVLSISLNAQNAGIYQLYCRPPDPDMYNAMLAFAESAREFVPTVTLTAIDGLAGVDIGACRAIAEQLGVGFRRRELGVVG